MPTIRLDVTKHPETRFTGGECGECASQRGGREAFQLLEDLEQRYLHIRGHEYMSGFRRSLM